MSFIDWATNRQNSYCFTLKYEEFGWGPKDPRVRHGQ
jgi:hypothetical protein